VRANTDFVCKIRRSFCTTNKSSRPMEISKSLLFATETAEKMFYNFHTVGHEAGETGGNGRGGPTRLQRVGAVGRAAGAVAPRKPHAQRLDVRAWSRTRRRIVCSLLPEAGAYTPTPNVYYPSGHLSPLHPLFVGLVPIPCPLSVRTPCSNCPQLWSIPVVSETQLLL
jgi:hypothetical protein